jgi:hypothetical protein
MSPNIIKESDVTDLTKRELNGGNGTFYLYINEEGDPKYIQFKTKDIVIYNSTIHGFFT